MRAVLLLSINALAGRRSRTALLALAVALSAALVAAVACALTSVNGAMAFRVTAALGRADLRISQVGEHRFDASILEVVERQPEVEVAAARLRGPVTLRPESGGKQITMIGLGIDVATEYDLVDMRLSKGRRVEGPGEVVLSDLHAHLLTGADEDESATPLKVGDTVKVVRWGAPIELKVVGILEPDALAALSLPGAYVSREVLAEITGLTQQISEIQVVLKEGAEPIAVAAAWEELPEIASWGGGQRLLVQPTERITSGINDSMRASNFGFLTASVVAFLASAFIVLTGMTTNVVERQRELAIMRCIGAERGRLALSQVLVGGMVGLMGAAVGIPLGIFLAWLIAVLFPERLPNGLTVPPYGVITSLAGAVGAGVVGSLWPALRAARVSPLRALSMRGEPSRASHVIWIAAAAVACLAGHLLIATSFDNGQRLFWAYVSLGVPLLMTGYFMLGVPMIVLLARLLHRPVSVVLGLPRSTLLNSVRGKPVRNGLTASALMFGLALMVAVWSTGSSVLRDWIGSIEFPDAFVHGWLGLTPESQRTLEGLDFVSDTCAITLHKIEDTTFGVHAIQPLKTTFIAFEPEPFFRMTNLHWVEGDPAYAQRRLEEGGAVLIAEEFRTAGGYHVGDTYTVAQPEGPVDFEIVGVISSPGLDLVSKYFDIGKEYAERALHSVFGSRADLKRIFDSEEIHLIQVGLKGNISDEEATERIRAALDNSLLVVGSGREIKEGILEIGRSTMQLTTIVALGAMLMGCFGVVNIVIAAIDARQFEFGVLRAVGGSAGLLVRLVLAEVLLIAVTACVLGTMMGVQHSLAIVRLYELLAGLQLRVHPPAITLVSGWSMTIGITMLAVTPVVWRLSRKKPRVLLGAVRG
ncbi:MAG: ABC transporter permease [Phycisphaerales bacterium]|nr:ABC transporter permease [Phycisphaerales bacterium]